jgi:hypothetical protein
METHTKLLREKAVLPLWPETGQVLGLSRATTYAAAQRGDIKTIRLGRLLRVPTAWLLRMKNNKGREAAERDPGPGWLRSRFMGTQYPRGIGPCGRPTCEVCQKERPGCEAPAKKVSTENLHEECNPAEVAAQG